jgi:DNA-directed RNA polymerase subunit RPC12/RpoP
MFVCPKCNTTIPFSKAFIINKNSIIQCKHCRQLLKPDSTITGRIQLWGGIFVGALTVAGYQLAGIIGAGIAAVAAYVIIAVINTKTIRFYLVE